MNRPMILLTCIFTLCCGLLTTAKITRPLEPTDSAIVTIPFTDDTVERNEASLLIEKEKQPWPQTLTEKLLPEAVLILGTGWLTPRINR